MPNVNLTLDELKDILMAGAGENEGADLSGNILDSDFDDLGYESLGLLETSRRIELKFGIKLDEIEFYEARTPRALLQLVNTSISNSAVRTQ